MLAPESHQSEQLSIIAPPPPHHHKENQINKAISGTNVGRIVRAARVAKVVLCSGFEMSD
jgi:hypothetical protein